MKLVLLAGPPSTGKTTIVKRIIEAFQKDQKLAYAKIDVVKANEADDIHDNYGIPIKTIYTGELCPDHAQVMVMREIIDWAEKLGSDIILLESAGLCLRCSPFVTEGAGIVVLNMLSGIHSVDKMQQLICFADIAVITMIDLVSQAEREIFIRKLKESHKNMTIIETNAKQGIAMERLYDLIEQSKDISFDDIQLKGNPPLGTCTVCIGNKQVGWQNHYGVVRKIDSNIGDYMYRGD
jgi:Ni2+-binding GTPase involved in maturation of urease and hydrogenase